MICTQEKGHDGPCTAGTTSGGCRKTAAKWFAPQETDAIPEVEPREVEAVEETMEDESGIGLQVDQEDKLVEVWVPVPGGVMAIPGDEWPTIDEATLTRYYRQTVVPPRERKEAVDWARATLAERDA